MMHCNEHDIDYDETIEFPGTHVVIGCPKCQEAYDKVVEEHENRKNDMEKDNARRMEIERYQSMNIEERYYDSTFENFITDTDELKNNLEAVKLLVSGKIEKIIMVGKNGTGKTHLAIAALKDKGGKIMTMYEIGTRIRQTYTSMAKESELDVVDELSRLPLLVIDEIGRTRGSDAELGWLSYIIDKRNSRYLPLILISNKLLRKDSPDDCLEQYIGADVMSRISQGGMVLNFSGKDWRRK